MALRGQAKDIDGETSQAFGEAQQVSVARLATRYDGRGASRLKTMRKADRSIREIRRVTVWDKMRYGRGCVPEMKARTMVGVFVWLER